MPYPPIDVLNGLKLSTSGFDKSKSYHTRLPGVEDQVQVFLHQSDFIKQNKDKFRVVFYEEAAQFHNNLGIFKIGIVDRKGNVLGSVTTALTLGADDRVMMKIQETSFSDNNNTPRTYGITTINNFPHLTRKLYVSFLNSIKRLTDTI